MCCSSHGFVIGHVVPEAQVGGPIALVRDGDVITIDAEANTMDMNVSEAEIEKRRAEWKAPPLKVNQGTLYKYVKLVGDASHGCITDAWADHCTRARWRSGFGAEGGTTGTTKTKHTTLRLLWLQRQCADVE